MVCAVSALVSKLTGYVITGFDQNIRLNMTDNFVNMSELLLTMTGSVLNMTGFVLYWD